MSAAIVALAQELKKAQARVKVLEEAIRCHRDQRGDDRCWLDDLILYACLPEGPPDGKALAQLPPEEMLANCRRFVASRHPLGIPYLPCFRVITPEAQDEQHPKRELPSSVCLL